MSDKPNLPGQIAALKAQLTTLRKRLTDQDSELQGLKDDLEKATMGIDELKAAVGQLVNQCHQAAKMIQDLRAQLAQGGGSPGELDQVGADVFGASDELASVLAGGGAVQQPGQGQPGAAEFQHQQAPQQTQAAPARVFRPGQAAPQGQPGQGQPGQGQPGRVQPGHQGGTRHVGGT